FASAPTNGNLVSATVVSGNVLLSDSGVLAANAVTAGSAAAATKQVCIASGASKSCTYIDFPDVKIIPAANCNNATPGAGWSVSGTIVPACRAGTNNLGGYLPFAAGNPGPAGQFEYELPNDWDMTSQPLVNLFF